MKRSRDKVCRKLFRENRTTAWSYAHNCNNCRVWTRSVSNRNHSRRGSSCNLTVLSHIFTGKWMHFDNSGAAWVEAGEAAAAADVWATGAGTTGDGTAPQPVSSFSLLILLFCRVILFTCCVVFFCVCVIGQNSRWRTLKRSIKPWRWSKYERFLLLWRLCKVELMAENPILFFPPLGPRVAKGRWSHRV